MPFLDGGVSYSAACGQGLEYSYAYGVAAKPPCSFGNALAKFNVAAGEATLWHEPGCIPGEPVMVGRPGAEVCPPMIVAKLYITKRCVYFRTFWFHKAQRWQYGYHMPRQWKPM